jgi:hypothetical protein
MPASLVYRAITTNIATQRIAIKMISQKESANRA